MTWRNRIITDPAILVGKPVIIGTRLAVEFVLHLLAEGWTHAEISDNYPGVTDADVRACLAYASAFLQAHHREPSKSRPTRPPADGKRRSASRGVPARRLSEANAAACRWLEEWMKKPPIESESFWRAFQRELHENRFNVRKPR